MDHGYLSPDPSASTSSKNGARSIAVNVMASPSNISSPYPVQQSTSGRDRKRASHQVTSSSRDRENQELPSSSHSHATPTYRDVYAHPAAVQYLAQHPKRTIPKFGPYLLLQTLGEGEFGKVKLGLHGQWGEEVAVKLIRRAGVDGTVRMSKVEREIEVLRHLRHPNIVHLYDVIETDKYIGIILECASGGELFDHILAHKYLKEKDACKLFAQLISGVWYMHNKKIVHRDLKLENLLLDRSRNVIITDFGFANRFEHRTDDLMQTSCGSPCYAAPELVISEGLYVGSAVDIWSCGVILYAMLAGYLPFDDDPENPDGDNINLLYKYIVNTELTFPDYISQAARDLLSLMLVPDPKRRADLRTIMLHPWLEPYRYLFERSVKDLEAMAAEQQRQKRLQYQKQMTRHAKDVHGSVSEKMMRSQSAAVRGTGTEGYDESFQPSSSLYDARPSASAGGNAVPPSTGRKATALSDALGSADDSSPRPQSVQAPLPSSFPRADHPATPGSGSRGKDSSKRTPSRHEAAGLQEESAALGSGTDTVRSKKGMRHTIQVEYSADPVPEMGDLSMSQLPTRTQANNDPFLSVNTGMSGPLHQMIEISESMPSTPLDANINVERRPPVGNQPQSEKETTPRKPANNMPVISISPSTPAKPTANSSQKITATSPANGDLGTHVNGANDSSPSQVPSSWPRSAESLTGQAQTVPVPERQVVNGSHPAEASSPTTSANTSIGSGSSKRTRHIRNISLDKLTFRRPGSASGKENLTTGQRSRRQIASESAPTSSYTNSMVSTATGTPSVSDADAGVSGEEKDTVKANDAKARRRKTLSIMMEPIKNRTIKAIKSRSVAVDTKLASSREELQTPTAATPPQRPMDPVQPVQLHEIYRPPTKSTLSASTSKAQKVMQWFRGGKHRIPSDDSGPEVIIPVENNLSGQSQGSSNFHNTRALESSSTVNRTDAPSVVITPASHSQEKGKRSNVLSWLPGRSVSSGPSHAGRGDNQKAATYDPALIRIHHGAVDVGTVASGSPPDLFRHVTQVLMTMGVEIQKEEEYKYRCIRPKKRRDGQNVGLGLKEAGSSSLSAFNVAGSATLNGVDGRGLPTSGSSSIIRNLLRRNPSRPGHTSFIPSDNEQAHSPSEFSPELSSPVINIAEPIYGDKTADQGDEVRFSVELTRIDRLDDTFSLDIRRLKGNLRSYKFLYDTLKARCNFQS